jgi:RNA polymerase sigma factor (sigma-70 family)
LEREKPAQQSLFQAAIEIVSAGSGTFKRTARRYSLCSQDAEDAYQRGLEILITKAPTTATAELRPWLHTVIKHEALALRRQRERLLGGSEEIAERAAASFVPDDNAAERERTRRAAEALGGLKASEVQCLLLKALGYSYDEITERTGFSWTKVNRSLTEGRRRFFERFEQIESGRRCNRFVPLLSVAADGEANERDERVLREHLRGCSSCRAALRSYRAAPARLAELIPPTLVLPFCAREGWWSRLIESVTEGTGDRAGALGWKLQQTGELLTAKKAAAVVASTAALAGGTVAQREVTHRHDSATRPALQAAERQVRPSTPDPAGQSDPTASPPSSPAASNPSPPEPARRQPARGGEFGLEPAATPAREDEGSHKASSASVSFEGQGGSGSSSSAGGVKVAGATGGEFGP